MRINSKDRVRTDSKDRVRIDSENIELEQTIRTE